MCSDIWDRETIELAVCWLLTTFPHQKSKDIVLQVPMSPSLLRLDWRWARPRLATTSPTTSTWPASARSRTWTGPSSPSTWSTGSTLWARRWTTLTCYLVSDRRPLSKGFIFLLFPSGKLEFSLKENWKPNWERVGTLDSAKPHIISCPAVLISLKWKLSC